MNEVDLMVKLGEKIRALRMKRKMTQNELAIECDFEKASMSRIESGLSNPTLRTIHRIAVALDVDLSELFKD